MPECW